MEMNPSNQEYSGNICICMGDNEFRAFANTSRSLNLQTYAYALLTHHQIIISIILYFSSL